jgi:hypothetical protein
MGMWAKITHLHPHMFYSWEHIHRSTVENAGLMAHLDIHYIK